MNFTGTIKVKDTTYQPGESALHAITDAANTEFPVRTSRTIA